METFIVVFEVEGHIDPRELCNSIENRFIVVGSCLGIDERIRKVTHLLNKVEALADAEFEVYDLSWFMELYNNEEVNEPGTFMSYVRVQEEGEEVLCSARK